VKDIKSLSCISLLTATEFLELKLIKVMVMPIIWEHLNETDGKKLEKQKQHTRLKQH
jgi:hypothetical protein